MNISTVLTVPYDRNIIIHGDEFPNIAVIYFCVIDSILIILLIFEYFFEKRIVIFDRVEHIDDMTGILHVSFEILDIGTHYSTFVVTAPNHYLFIFIELA